MVYPPYASPFPDTRSTDITLGAQQRAILTLMAQKPGRVFTNDELATKLSLPHLSPRRAGVLISGINDVLGEETISEVPRRGWQLSWYEDSPITISF
jgi:DNA-binding winged helix-turn-helix (wHTH) protein